MHRRRTRTIAPHETSRGTTRPAERRCRLAAVLVAVAVLGALLAIVAPPVPARAAVPPPVFTGTWGTTGAGEGQFDWPQGVAVDGSGDVYVADSYNHRVQRFTSAGVFVTGWGTYGAGEGQFDLPTGVAVDGSGDVYVADSANNRVQKFTSAGVFVAEWGTSGAGEGQFGYPQGLAVDGSGHVYVADTFNNRVQKFTSAGVFVAEWGTEGDGEGQFFFPYGVAVDGAGNVYVADTFNHRVQGFTSAGEFVTEWSSEGSVEEPFRPIAVTVDGAGDVYVTDRYHYRVLKFTSSGEPLTAWGTGGSADGEFSVPNGLAVDGTGTVYVVDAGNSRVQRFAPAPAPSMTVGASADESSVVVGDTVHLHVQVTNTGNVGLTDVTIDDANGPACEVAPFALAVGEELMVDCEHVASAGEVAGGYHNTASVTSTELTTPVVSNTVHVTVTPAPAPALSVNMSADESSVVVGDPVHLHAKVTNTGNVALTNVTITDANAAGCEAAPFSLAVGLDHTVDCTHVATAGEVVGGYHNSASVVSTEVTTPAVSNTVSVTVTAAPSSDPPVFVNRWGSFGAGNGQFANPYGVATDGTGRVYVADTNNHRVQVFTAAGDFINRWGSVGSGAGQFSSPSGVAVDSSGNVYVADYANSRVQKFTSAGVFLATWGTGGSADGQLSFPSAVAVDAAGDVYVADTFNQRVQQFTSAGAFVRKWGTGGSGDGEFSQPSGVAVDGAGNVYVADTFNHRVQKFSSTGVFRTAWGTEGSGDGQFSYPIGVAADAEGNVYVADTYNARIQRFTASGAFVSRWGRRGTADGQLDSPRGVAVDAAGHVFVADTNNSRVQQFAPAPPPAPALSVNMSADESSVTVGDTVHLHVKVRNTGNLALTNVAITDANAPGCEAAPFAVGVGADRSVDCTHVATADEVAGGYHNSASVVSTEVTTPVVSNTVDVTVLPVPVPALTVVASADEVSVAPGQAINQHLVVSNTGNVALHTVTISDPAAPDCADDGAFDLAVGGFTTIDCAYTTTGNDAGTYTNEASVIADEVTTPVASNQVDVTVDDAITVVLSADQSSVVAAQAIGYHVTVKNTSALTLVGLQVADEAAPDCAGGLGFGILPAGAQIVVDCTHVPGAADVGTFSNVATVDSGEIVAVESNQVDVTVVAPAPALTVTETADPTEVVAGEPIDLALTVRNTGNVRLHRITVADPSVPGCQVKVFDLAVGAQRMVFCTYVSTGADVPIYQNHASVGAAELDTPVESNIVSVAVTIPAGSAHVAGTVTEQGSGDPIVGAVAVLLSPVDYSPVAVGAADAAGHFSVLAAPGSYYVYVLDPADDHTAAFHGAPSLVVASADSTTAADTDLVSTRGTVTGEVTADSSGDPVVGVMAMTVDLDSGEPGAGDLTDADGRYTISGLRPGPKLVEFVDLSGGRRPEFFDDRPTPAGASIVSVVGASQATADAGLAAQSVPAGGAHLVGELTSTAGGPLEGVAVMAVRTADFSLAAGVLTDSTGHYDLDLDAGTYKVAVYDPTGAHGFEWFDDQGPDGLADAATVTAVAGAPTTVDTALTPTTGVVSGTVTETGSGAPLADVGVFAIDATGTVVGVATTGADGTYTLAGLPAGDHRIRFVDLTGAHTSEYHLDAPDYGTASLRHVAAGGATPGIDAALTPTG